ncbi:MAG: hypothetical protein A3J48_01790 [Candidatus Doudnabacteria bacterium RIFCSPHIGHO2_02_FULL_46_11]|uniref:Uncharacterized protein n=1 Tax=Candidatus Doudnabacteria bacterium RIFCSPHIGHO2_02_FULL_46_11 TaxID=1817832 RepID=A0A1F5PAA9_9BACT|nr:MAG: hypothetical protein A3J48_01790 [Candidatus Doudnabacteria bacterium RIFCSPHIGHO2_02_FULL_46_11]
MADKPEDSLVSNIKFTVMPDLEGIGSAPQEPPAPPMAGGPGAPEPPIAPQNRPMPHAPPMPAKPAVAASSLSKPDIRQKPTAPPIPPPPKLTQDLERHLESKNGPKSGRRRELMVALIAFLVVGLIAFAGFMIWQSQKSESVAEENTMNQEEDTTSSGTITETPIDDNKDTDNDGLTDIEEQELGTAVNDSDTDGDGLADGDEFKVFRTSPFTPHSDDDNFNDGKELRDGYSPTAGGEVKLTEAEIESILAKLSQGALHEPTVTTLASGPLWQDKTPDGPQNTPPVSASSGQFAYQDEIYHYQVVLPGSWKKTQVLPTNITFIEQNSANARYLQIQAMVNVNSAGQVTSEGLIEAELQRLGKMSTGEVRYKEAQIGGTQAYRFALESKRESSNPSSLGLLSSTIEYIVPQPEAAFIVTVSCTSQNGLSCINSAEELAQVIEKDMRF